MCCSHPVGMGQTKISKHVKVKHFQYFPEIVELLVGNSQPIHLIFY